MKYTTPLCAALFSAAVIYFLPSQSFEKAAAPAAASMASLYGNGGFDDPDERLKYEFARLHNPFTNEVPEDMRKRELAFAATLPRANEASRCIQWQNRGPYNL